MLVIANNTIADRLIKRGREGIDITFLLLLTQNGRGEKPREAL
jgi:hypothetical protein